MEDDFETNLGRESVERVCPNDPPPRSASSQREGSKREEKGDAQASTALTVMVLLLHTHKVERRSRQYHRERVKKRTATLDGGTHG